MQTRFPSWSRRSGVALVAGLTALTLAWALLHVGWFGHRQIVDLPVYEQYGWAMAQGHVPYRDFSLEYPPGALPAFLLPALGTVGNPHDFRQEFETLMFLCACGCVAAVALALGALRASSKQLWAALLFVGIAPLALGSVVLTRFDLWPAALAAVAVATLLSARPRLGHGLLGVAVAAKAWPVVLAPIFVAHVWRTRGRREGVVCAGVLTAVVAAIVLPFFALAPGGVWQSVVRQTTRPLQIESIGAALIVVSHHVLGTGAEMVSSHGSQNLGGRTADVVGALQSIAQVAALLAIWIWFARKPRDRAEVVRACAAATVAFVALGKVLSPQFLIWLVPLVPLVRGARGVRAAVLLGISLVLTQAWFPQHYWSYALHFSTPVSFLVLARDLALLTLLGVLVAPDWRTWDGAPRAREKPFGASVVVRRGDDVLVLHRAHNGPDYDGDWAWTPPSGARLPGESPDECARRELREEAGLELEPVRLPSQHDDWACYVAYAPDEAEIVLDGEHDAFRWLPLDEAAALCKPARVAASLLDAHAHGLDRVRTS